MKSSGESRNICLLFLFIFTAVMDSFKTFRNIPFFQELSDEEINILVSISTPRFLRKKRSWLSLVSLLTIYSLCLTGC